MLRTAEALYRCGMRETDITFLGGESYAESMLRRWSGQVSRVRPLRWFAIGG